MRYPIDPMQFDGVPTVFFQFSKRVKTRKPHKCYICKREIRVGETADKVTIMTSDNARPYTVYYCERC